MVFTFITYLITGAIYCAFAVGKTISRIANSGESNIVDACVKTRPEGKRPLSHEICSWLYLPITLVLFLPTVICASLIANKKK